MKIKVMVVEDDKCLREEIVILLKSLDLSVCSADNGLVAINMFLVEKVDIIFSDIDMPAIDGIKLLKYFKTVVKDKPLIYIMSDSFKLTHKEMIDLGAADIFQKPVTLDKFKTIFNQKA